jgi:hypothetical protein
MSARLGDDEFVGYIFQGSPERRPRLWFLERMIDGLFLYGPVNTARRPGVEPAEADLDVGVWKLIPVEGLVYMRGHLRYEHHGTERWTAVWQLTDLTIPHVHTFGRDDDVWRLGVWPD